MNYIYRWKKHKILKNNGDRKLTIQSNLKKQRHKHFKKGLTNKLERLQYHKEFLKSHDNMIRNCWKTYDILIKIDDVGIVGHLNST